jgi:hypothetical protein
MVADAADGADGIFPSCTHPDGPCFRPGLRERLGETGDRNRRFDAFASAPSASSAGCDRTVRHKAARSIEIITYFGFVLTQRQPIVLIFLSHAFRFYDALHQTSPGSQFFVGTGLAVHTGPLPVIASLLPTILLQTSRALAVSRSRTSSGSPSKFRVR